LIDITNYITKLRFTWWMVMDKNNSYYIILKYLLN